MQLGKFQEVPHLHVLLDSLNSFLSLVFHEPLSLLFLLLHNSFFLKWEGVSRENELIL